MKLPTTGRGARLPLLVSAMLLVAALVKSADGSPNRAPVRFASALFTMGLPWAHSASLISMPKPNYPSDSRAGGVEGYLLLRFVVTEDGVVDPATLHNQLIPGIQ